MRQVWEGHLLEVLLDFVELELATVVQVVQNPDFLDFGQQADVPGDLGFLLDVSVVEFVSLVFLDVEVLNVHAKFAFKNILYNLMTTCP